MKSSIILLAIYASMFCLVSCEKVESTVKTSASSSKEVKGPRTVCIDYWHEREEDSIGFVMEASWDEHSSEVSVKNMIGIESTPVATQLKEPIIKHLFSFFDIDQVRSFEVSSDDFRSKGYFHFVVFDSIDFEYKYYQIQSSNETVNKWIAQLEILHSKTKRANKM